MPLKPDLSQHWLYCLQNLLVFNTGLRVRKCQPFCYPERTRTLPGHFQTKASWFKFGVPTPNQVGTMWLLASWWQLCTVLINMHRHSCPLHPPGQGQRLAHPSGNSPRGWWDHTLAQDSEAGPMCPMALPQSSGTTYREVHPDRSSCKASRWLLLEAHWETHALKKIAGWQQASTVIIPP